MTNLLEIVKDIIYILFPFLCYTIYVAYCNNVNKKESSLILSAVLFISMYLSATHLTGNNNNTIYPPLMLNIPLLIAYMKDKKESIILMSIFIMILYSTKYQLSPIISILEYLLYYVLFNIVSKIKQENKKYVYILVFCIIKITMHFIQIILIDTNIIELIKYYTLAIPFILSSILIVVLLDKSERIINLNISIKELEKEKQLRNSLFNIAHEIKNPLAVCKGYLEMLDFKNKNHEKYIPIIQNELKRSVTLMNDMLNITKIKINPEYMDMNVLLEEIKMCIDPLIKNKNVKVNMHLTKEETYIYADYTRLKHVFIDIIKSSVEALSNLDKERIINIDVSLKKNKIITTIKDNGKGMTKEELKQMNMPFYIPNSKNKALGLTLANEIIKCHNGEIEYQSKLNKGTTAIITLPSMRITN